MRVGEPIPLPPVRPQGQVVREQWAPRAELPFSLRSVLGLPPSPGPALATLPQGLVLISLGNPHLGAKGDRPWGPRRPLTPCWPEPCPKDVVGTRTGEAGRGRHQCQPTMDSCSGCRLGRAAGRRLKTTIACSLSALEVRSPNSRCQEGHAASETLGRILPHLFPGGSDRKESACNARDWGSIPGSRRSPGERNGYPLQYSCLEKSMDREAWRATVCGVAKSQTQLSD